MIMRTIWTRLAPGIAALALALASGSASAWQCDFLTGGGFIIGTPPKTLGARYICGTARTNQAYGDVNFVVYAEDEGEPGVNDIFVIRLTQPVGQNVPQRIVYTTEFDSNKTLGGGGFGGGNIQLHQPNNSITGTFGFFGDGKCPALDFAVGA